jgi:DNA-binding NarL/FixJ family response regulator
MGACPDDMRPSCPPSLAGMKALLEVGGRRPGGTRRRWRTAGEGQPTVPGQLAGCWSGEPGRLVAGRFRLRSLLGLLALVRSARPDLAIIDIRMPPAQATEGLQAARVIRAELPGTAIIVLSAHVEVDEAIELLAGGEALGYLLKSRVTDVAEFIETVERITAGASVVDPSLVQELVKARRRRDPLEVLSPREHDVLALMAEGASNAGVARRIFVTEGTVEKHVRSILTKLNLPESDAEHRRVLAVLRFLEAR